MVRDAAEGEELEKEGEVREAVGVGGAVVVFIRAVARRRGECFALRSGEEAVTVGEAEGTGYERIRDPRRLACGPTLSDGTCLQNERDCLMQSCCYRDD